MMMTLRRGSLFQGYGGVVTMSLHSEEAAKAFMTGLRIFHVGGSLGAVEGLIEHVCVMSHGDYALNEEVTPQLQNFMSSNKEAALVLALFHQISIESQ